MTPRTAWRFWLAWAVMSSLGAGAGYVVGVIAAIIVGAFPYVLGGLVLAAPAVELRSDCRSEW